LLRLIKDANDAEATVAAASRPSMNFVPIKQVEPTIEALNAIVEQ